MIDVQNVSKSYGPVQALAGVSFHVEAGEVIGLLGPNGAGKTTMMKILTGYLQPDEGQVKVDGLDVLTDTLQVQRLIGYLPENAPLYPEMSVQSYLKMIAELRQVPEASQLALLAGAVRATSLEDHLVRPIGQLSKGYRQRVGLAQALLHQPKLLILDEPTVGLDPTQIVEVRELIRRLAHQSTVLLSTHILSEVEATCDRVIILLNGQVRADARLSELAATTDVVLVLADGAMGARAELKKMPGVQRVEVTHTPDGEQYRIHGVEGQDLRDAVYTLVRERGWALRELRRDVRTLESVFNDLATQAEGKRVPVEEAVAL
ncbi:MAG TPA: ATP-binding cassette domain-containing protein [Anaerolineae bacterium]|nr:ATP-binding cassette domain-containing protein [Anaerolineae bacterium]